MTTTTARPTIERGPDERGHHRERRDGEQQVEGDVGAGRHHGVAAAGVRWEYTLELPDGTKHVGSAAAKTE